MELKLSEGKYMCDDRGTPISAKGDDEIVARALFKLTTKYGSFPFLPNLGSRLYKLPYEKNTNLQNAAYQYVLEALSDETEVVVEDVIVEPLGDNIGITVSLNHNGNIIEINLTV